MVIIGILGGCVRCVCGNQLSNIFSSRHRNDDSSNHNLFWARWRSQNIHAPKIYLRSLLFATAKKGRIVEAMYASLSRSQSRQNFSVWVLGEDRLARGSGLYVGLEGVLADHHSLTPAGSNNFAFLEGTYRLEIFARLFGDEKTIKPFSENFTVDADAAHALTSRKRGLYFDWGPDSGRYFSHLQEGAPTTPVKGPMTDQDWENIVLPKPNRPDK